MDKLVHDVRYALRTLRQNLGFALLVVACLALGIGVDSTIFSVVDAVAIRPLPFKDPERIIALGTARRATERDPDAASYPDFVDWRARTHSFSDMAADTGSGMIVLSDGGEPERLDAHLVSANMFPLLGVQPIIGRQFRADDDRIGAARVLLISYAVWQRRYARDPAVLGRGVLLDNDPATIIGVMPARFAFPLNVDLWMPLTPGLGGDREKRTSRRLSVYGRLKPEVAFEAARADVAAAGARLAETIPEDKDWFAIAQTLRENFIPQDAIEIVFVMLAAATCVLFIACGNVANLLLARATARQREIAVRAALGAGRARLVRQLLTESVVLALASAPLGLLLAAIGLRWLSASVPAGELPYYINWDLNGRVLVYIIAVAVCSGLIFGLAPIMPAARRDLFDTLKDAARGSTAGARRSRLRSVLVVAEVALAVVVLVGAALFVRTFRNFETARGVIATDGLMTLRVLLRSPVRQTPEALTRRADALVRRIESMPAVESAVASQMVPFAHSGSRGRVLAEGRDPAKENEQTTLYFGAMPHMLRTLRQPLVAGREFTEAEALATTPLAIVNGAFARRVWPGEASVMGRRFRFVNQPQNGWFTVIGVVGDFRLFTVRDGAPSPYVFVPFPYDASPDIGLIIRAAGVPPASITSAARAQIRAVDPATVIFDEQTGDEARARTYWEYRLYGWMFGTFGVVALLLAAIGVYGVLAHSVSQRTQEIGVRMALGASRQEVFRMVLGSAARLAVPGVILGIAVGLAGGRVIASFLYNVSPADPASFVGAAVFLLAVALAAAYVPARRAMAVDPIVALRTE